MKDSSEDILHFVNDIVNPDYEEYISTGINYEKDAEFVDTVATEFTETTQTISSTIEDVNLSINSISTHIEKSLTETQEILDNITQATLAVEELAKSSQYQAESTERINMHIVNKFKCD